MTLKRRTAIESVIAAAGMACFAQGADRPTTGNKTPQAVERFRYCLNTSTIRGQEPGADREVEIAAAAGYDGIEPWIPNLRKYREGGGNLKDLASRIRDAGLTVDSAIGFAQWIAEDAEARKKGLEEARRDMEMLRELGGTRIAAPPVGAHDANSPVIPLDVAAERFAALQKIGDDTGVIPQLEVWGFSKNLSRIGEVAYVAAETGHPQSLLLLDAYHIHKGGSDFNGLGLFSDNALQVFHINDYPADPPREKISDADRVYPGDGVAPLNRILKSLAGTNRTLTLSLELFNRDYWKQDMLQVAKTGLEKMKTAVAAAMSTNE